MIIMMMIEIMMKWLAHNFRACWRRISLTNCTCQYVLASRLLGWLRVLQNKANWQAGRLPCKIFGKPLHFVAQYLSHTQARLCCASIWWRVCVYVCVSVLWWLIYYQLVRPPFEWVPVVCARLHKNHGSFVTIQDERASLIKEEF